MSSSVLLAADRAGGAWPPQVRRITYISPADKTAQPSLYYDPETAKPAPLLIALHTWSSDYRQDEAPYAMWCIKKGWVFMHPNFRGPNNRPEAMGSELAVKDILGAVDYAKSHAKVDPSRIYLIGASGGGYAALLMAGRSPQTWTAVSAWVPPYNLADFHRQCVESKRVYAKMMESACGGAPGASADVDHQYFLRSASSYMQNALSVPLDINAGIDDGHTGAVPIMNSLGAFNALAKTEDRLSEADITFMTEKQTVPERLAATNEDSCYGKHTVLFRRISGNARVTIFKGSHQIIWDAALMWLEQQSRGMPPRWDIPARGAVEDSGAPLGK